MAKIKQIVLALLVYMMLETMFGETELMIQLSTVMLHQVHKMNCGESGLGFAMVPSTKLVLCREMSVMIIDLAHGK